MANLEDLTIEQLEFQAPLRADCADELERRKIEKFEQSTGLTFDTDGPSIIECEYCGGLLQFVPDHDCYGTRGENGEAARD